jgi:hypothetical protein
LNSIEKLKDAIFKRVHLEKKIVITKLNDAND